MTRVFDQRKIAKNKIVMANVDKLMQEKGMSAAEFAQQMGVLSSYVSNWRRRGMPADRWLRAAEVLETSVDVLTGRISNGTIVINNASAAALEGFKLVHGNINIDLSTGSEEFHNPENMTLANGAFPVILNGSIPIIGCAKLGDDGYFADVFADPDYTQGTLNINSRDPLAYAIRCEGHSMAPRIQPGEFVIAEPSVEASPGDEVVVEDNEGRRMVKRFLYHRDDCYHFASINQDFNPIVIEDKEIKSIHPVLAIVPKKFWRPT